MPGTRGDHRRQRRHCDGAAGRFRSRRDPQECGSRDVRRQGRRQAHLALLQAGNGRRGAGPPRAGNGSAPGDRRGSGLDVHYQPCLDLQDGRITGCEALVRWRHPARGMISAADFVPIAEETGLINQLGEWVLTTACNEAATWPNHVRLAVNVSPVQFKSGTLALKVMAALAASGLAAGRLELEITEAVLIRDDDAALAILHQLRDIGVRIALDDFGTGYSSLSYLQRFPFDKIKIDRCYVTDTTETGGSSCIVRAVVNIAAERDMTTTAEGVETRQQQELLRALGCSEMQGYLFSPAQPAAELKRLFFSHRARREVVALFANRGAICKTALQARPKI